MVWHMCAHTSNAGHGSPSKRSKQTSRLEGEKGCLPRNVLSGSLQLCMEVTCKDCSPAMVYQHETIQVQKCATTASTGVFKDPMSRTKHRLNPKLEVNNFASTVLGSLTYEGRHSHCDGMDSSINGRRMESLFVTESLEVTIRTVTIQEELNSRDIVVKENGVSIPAAFRQDQGMVTDFGNLAFQ